MSQKKLLLPIKKYKLKTITRPNTLRYESLINRIILVDDYISTIIQPIKKSEITFVKENDSLPKNPVKREQQKKNK